MGFGGKKAERRAKNSILVFTKFYTEEKELELKLESRNKDKEQQQSRRLKPRDG